MAAVLPKPPPMAYTPHHDTNWPHGRTSPYDPHAASYQQTHTTEYSPFSPGLPSSALSSPGYANNPSFDSHMLGKAMSDDSYASSMSSPARSSYHGGIHQQMRDSAHSNQSTISHNSNRSAIISPLASPQPLNPSPAVEKQQFQNPSRNAPSSRTKSYGYTASSRAAERDGVVEVILEHKALKILIYLSAFNTFISFIIFLYTIFALLAIILLQPFRLCTKRTTFRQQVIDFLSPPLKIQQAFIYSAAKSENYSIPLLILVQVLAPVVSMGVTFAAWVAGAFWFFNAILGDPAGSDSPRGYNDGRASVIGVRRWWERWLTRALR
ncbi:hypothetical protein EJ08DRAFT_658506 [Tothia fuscella]|uniref:Uncharacterized protein n=1 Tax=Tothia fuscella TaxID=1048955 RepID=A0A9P4NY65_9PEZI|nr:hypothetical protein EJ08DRAFT_658506 [Tothia fuscella]